MAHTYSNLFVHCVFSTKGRRRLLTEAVQERLWPMMGGIARQKGFVACVVGGTADHAHILLSLPTTLSVAKAIQIVKAESSAWVSRTFQNIHGFAWQEGYAAFSVSMSNKNKVVRYIAEQAEHHRQQTFQQEYLALLKRHGIEYDERYVWD